MGDTVIITVSVFVSSANLSANYLNQIGRIVSITPQSIYPLSIQFDNEIHLRCSFKHDEVELFVNNKDMLEELLEDY